MCSFYFADSRWILLSADSEGFVPLTFTATQEIIIRDGGSSKSSIFRESLSQSLDFVLLKSLETLQPEV